MNVYEYPYGPGFTFITISELDGNFTMVYNLSTKRIVQIATMILEQCKCVGSIDSKEASRELWECLQFNLGYILVKSSCLGVYLKNAACTWYNS